MKALALKAIAIVAALALALVLWNHYIGGVRAAADAGGYARRDGEQKAADNKALNEALADVSRLNKLIQGISANEKIQRDAAAASAAAASAAGERLRAAEARLRAISVRACPGAAATPGGASADPAAGVLADMQRRLDEAQDRVAGFADASRRAGLACEQIHDAVK